ncbi:DUF4340 domain-containing protein [Candidatus Halobeggiatoa sp. HSG11]|nr:DUF4340 domain-containing protein [Candidatus Halobeggiatoa sp. HSG11]
MNTKNLGVLIVVTIVVVVAAISLTQTEVTPIEKGKLFPELATTIDQVKTVNVKTNAETVTMTRDENWNWKMQEKHNYPVEADKVNSLLLAMTELTILEAKTSNSELYSKVGVDDVSAQNSSAVLLTLKTDSDTLTSLIIGNSQAAKIDSTRNEIYVRKPEDKQVWLTLGKLSVETTLTDWLERQIVDMENNKVHQVNISNGENISIFKATPTDEEFQLADLPVNGKIKTPYVLKNIATTLSNLEFDDVIAADTLKLDFTTTAIFTTFDGLEVTMQVAKQDEKNYAIFAAKFNAEAVVADSKETEDDSKTDSEKEAEPDINKQVADLNAKFAGWVYELSNYKVDDLAKTREELIEIEEPEEELATPTTEVSETPIISDELPIPFTLPSK